MRASYGGRTSAADGRRAHIDRVGSAIIDFTEAAYDLDLSDEEWLPTVLERGLSVLDHGLGVAGIEYGRPPDGGALQFFRIEVASGPQDFPEQHKTALAAWPPELLREQARTGLVSTMSENTKGHPEALDDPAAAGAFVGIVAVSTARSIDRAAQRIGTPLGADDVEPLTWAMAEIGRGRGAVEYQEAVETIIAERGKRVTPTLEFNGKYMDGNRFDPEKFEKELAELLS